MTLSTHVLDAALGRLAAGAPVALHRHALDEGRTEVARGVTDGYGRLRAVDSSGDSVVLDTGIHRIEFDTATYFNASGQRGFCPEVSITFEVIDSQAHYHVPLLLSPFAYSTYRGG